MVYKKAHTESETDASAAMRDQVMAKFQERRWVWLAEALDKIASDEKMPAEEKIAMSSALVEAVSGDNKSRGADLLARLQGLIKKSSSPVGQGSKMMALIIESGETEDFIRKQEREDYKRDPEPLERLMAKPDGAPRMD